MDNSITSTVDHPPLGKIAKRNAKNRRRLLCFVLVLVILVIFLCCIGVFGGNVHAIQPGRAYRSATLTGVNYTGLTARLTGNDLESVIRRDHIGTVISLRGGSVSDDWYRQEIDACRHESIVHEDVPFSARSLPG